MTGYKKIFLDTAPMIYLLEYNDKYTDFLREKVSEWNDEGVIFQTSVITVEEYCVIPFRDDNKQLIDKFEKLLSDLEVDVIDINYQISKMASFIRAKYRSVKGMDALQIASSIELGCDVFLSNDIRLKQVTEANCLFIDEMINGV